MGGMIDHPSRAWEAEQGDHVPSPGEAALCAVTWSQELGAATTVAVQAGALGHLVGPNGHFNGPTP